MIMCYKLNTRVYIVLLIFVDNYSPYQGLA